MLRPIGTPSIVGSTVQQTYAHTTETTRGVIERHVELTVDLDALATLAPRALSSERNKATLYFGAVIVKVKE